MSRILDVLHERGFIDQKTHERELETYLRSGEVTCYIGFDPTADSLHVGSLVPIMSLAHMQREGCRPIALVGGGTGLVGDPSGKTEMRKLLTEASVRANAAGIKRQLSRFLDFDQGRALLLNNADWLVELKYIPFLRDIGRHFSVNRMIKTESCQMRLDSEEGLSFIEFNYMVLQAYDFLVLSDQYGCRLQMGGSDQWGNIVAGIDLIRRMRQTTAFGITFPLITTASGAKMGKTARGAIWLDPKRTSPYEYYQYWINTEDADVSRFLALFTFLPMDEIHAARSLEGARLNGAKAVLSFEATRLAHGLEAALDAFHASSRLFGTPVIPGDLLPSSSIPREETAGAEDAVPTTVMDASTLKSGIPAFKLFHTASLAPSGSAARRLIEQGGAYINGERVKAFDMVITDRDMVEDAILLRAGKKKFHKIKIKS
ncbi:MAG: tyrosine--tRNA ligase [Deltaproteobacteria bacterium]|nr:tyrosine--tRNA ligase [Deltaproteobacteria bacterium]MBW2132642.1 tyrosine--tRNA ligase [Deltaproteobacteria bacterium]